jgi:hypothetical protein
MCGWEGVDFTVFLKLKQAQKSPGGPGMVMHTYNPRTQKAKAGRS